MAQKKVRHEQVDVGTNPDQLVKLDSLGRLPAVDGSNLTGVSGGDIVDDLSPQLGGNLDLNSFNLFTVAVGSPASASTDSFTFTGGNNSAGAGTFTAGGATIQGGIGSNGNDGGPIVINGGASVGGGYGGYVYISSGSGTLTSGAGTVSIISGNSSNSSFAGGNVDITSGDNLAASGAANAGDITLTAGDSDTSTSGYGGDINLYAGASGTAVSTGGQIRIVAGGGGYYAGKVTIQGGDGNNYAGDAILKGGSSANNFSGDVTIQGGYSSNGDPGDTKVYGGAGNSAGGIGGYVRIKGGNSTGGAAGAHVLISGGDAIATKQSGSVKILPGGGAGIDGFIEFHSSFGYAGQAEIQLWNDTNVSHTTGNYIVLKAPATVANRTWTLPDDDPSVVNGQFLTTDASGILSFAVAASALNDLTDVIVAGSPLVSGQVLKFNGTNWVNDTDTGGINNIVEDTTPQLGGDLDTNGFNIITPTTQSPQSITIQTGATNTTGAYSAGSVSITAGTANLTSNVAGGSINLSAGNSHAGAGIAGDIVLLAGNSDYGTAGDITLTAGESNGGSGDGGIISIVGGYAGGEGSHFGGDVNITGGKGNGLGGSIVLTPGKAGLLANAGAVALHAPALLTGPATIQLWNDTDTGHTTGNYVALQAPVGSPAIADLTLTLPTKDGTNGQVLSTDGSGNLSFISSGGGGSTKPQFESVTPTGSPPSEIINTTVPTVAIGGSPQLAGVQVFRNGMLQDEGVDIGSPATITEDFVVSGANQITFAPSILHAGDKIKIFAFT